MTISYLVHGADESYYTGKLESYLRAKGIPYDVRPFGPASMRHCARHTGVVQIPQVECSDGTWLVDTTLIIEYFEKQRPEPRVVPDDPATAFVSALLEDYADEWLWRPAMHYRWSYPETARLMSGWLAEHLNETPGPMLAKKVYWRIRQRGIFVEKDGVNAATWRATEDSYTSTLDALEAIFRTRPYVMGERPTPADFGFFASMFRHFGSDPTPARIMRRRAAGVYEWVARMWNMSPERCLQGALPMSIPGGLEPLTKAIATIYLPYLDANERAYAGGQETVEYWVQGVRWCEPVKPYRVWCLDRLRRARAALDAVARARIDELFGTEGIAPLDRAALADVPAVVAELPIRGGRPAAVVDSWWRRRG
jgi:glutathione S-transferase